MCHNVYITTWDLETQEYYFNGPKEDFDRNGFKLPEDGSTELYCKALDDLYWELSRQANSKVEIPF